MPAPRSDRFVSGRMFVFFCLMVLSAGRANAGALRGLQDDLTAVNQAFASASLDPAAPGPPTWRCPRRLMQLAAAGARSRSQISFRAAPNM